MIHEYVDALVVECDHCCCELGEVAACRPAELTFVHWCPDCLDAVQERVISDLEHLADIDRDPHVAAFMRQAGLVEDPGLASGATEAAARPCIHAAE